MLLMHVEFTMGNPPNGWFIIGHLIKMDDLEVPIYFRKAPHLDMNIMNQGPAIACQDMLVS